MVDGGGVAATTRNARKNENLSGVHDVLGIDRTLHCALQIDVILTMPVIMLDDTRCENG